MTRASHMDYDRSVCWILLTTIKHSGGSSGFALHALVVWESSHLQGHGFAMALQWLMECAPACIRCHTHIAAVAFIHRRCQQHGFAAAHAFQLQPNGCAPQKICSGFGGNFRCESVATSIAHSLRGDSVLRACSPSARWLTGPLRRMPTWRTRGGRRSDE